MDKELALGFVDVFCNNVNYELRKSSANIETKKLVHQVAEETAAAMAAIIQALSQ